MIIGEEPGKAEVAAGKPFQRRSGAEIDRLLEKAGASREQFWITNAFKSRPINPDGTTREATIEEIQEHGTYLKAELEKKKPRVILLLGERASSMFGLLPRPEYILIRTDHPSWILRADTPQGRKDDFEDAFDLFVKLARTI
jgi:uracil-DNA glycosylase